LETPVSEKPKTELTDEELIRELFPEEVVGEAKREVEKAEKRAPTSKKKPEKSADRR
jgi:hypothetical protein